MEREGDTRATEGSDGYVDWAEETREREACSYVTRRRVMAK